MPSDVLPRQPLLPDGPPRDPASCLAGAYVWPCGMSLHRWQRGLPRSKQSCRERKEMSLSGFLLSTASHWLNFAVWGASSFTFRCHLVL